MNSSIWECIFCQNRGGAKIICGATSRMIVEYGAGVFGKVHDLADRQLVEHRRHALGDVA